MNVDDFVYVRTGDAFVALDRDDGRERWLYERGPNEVVYDAVVEDGISYVATSERAAVLENGEPRWQRPYERDDLQTRIDGIASGLLLISTNGIDDEFRLYAFDVTTGEPAWQTDAVRLPRSVGKSSVEIHDGVVYVAANGVRALDLATGRERWSGAVGGDPVHQLLIADESVPQGPALVVQTGNSTLTTVTLQGEETWRTAIHGRVTDVLDGALLYVETDEAIRALAIPGTRS